MGAELIDGSYLRLMEGRTLRGEVRQARVNGRVLGEARRSGAMKREYKFVAHTLEGIVELMGGLMVYLDNPERWHIVLPVRDGAGRSLTCRLDIPLLTTLEDAQKMLADFVRQQALLGHRINPGGISC